MWRKVNMGRIRQVREVLRGSGVEMAEYVCIMNGLSEHYS